MSVKAEYEIVQPGYLVADHPVEIEVEAPEYKTSKHTIIKQEISNLGYNCVQYAKTKSNLPSGLSTLQGKMAHIKTRQPVEGAIGVTSEGPVGHLVVVEKIESDGLIISEGNYRHGYVTWRKVPGDLILGYM